MTYHRPLTFAEVFDLPLTVDLKTAARALGMCVETAYRLISEDHFPCCVLRPGHRYIVPTTALLRALGIEQVPVDIRDVEAASTIEAFDNPIEE